MQCPMVVSSREARVWFVFCCWNCEEDNELWGEPVASWWTQKYWVDDEWHCWLCRAVNITHDPPWTEA